MMMRSSTNRVVPDMQSEHGAVNRPIPTGRTNSPPGLRWGLSASSSSKPNHNKASVSSSAAKDSSSSSLLQSPRSPRRILKSLRNHAVAIVPSSSSSSRRQKEQRKDAKIANRNLTQFLTTDCPTDVLPKILAYAGPNAAAALQQTSRHFRNVLNSEGTWRGLCEELYKVCTPLQT